MARDFNAYIWKIICKVVKMVPDPHNMREREKERGDIFTYTYRHIAYTGYLAT